MIHFTTRSLTTTTLTTPPPWWAGDGWTKIPIMQKRFAGEHMMQAGIQAGSQHSITLWHIIETKPRGEMLCKVEEALS